MERKDFIGLVKTAVADYIAADEAFDDDARLQVDPATFEVAVVDGEDADDSVSELDFFPMMELVEMDADGNWHIDTQAVEAVADEYFN
ncbi:MAG: hypothetical protein HDS24_04965 [Bacteroides sp.]|nr:hypothetical protein [Bacteroides sp.]